MMKDILKAVVIRLLRVCSYGVKVERCSHHIWDTISRLSYSCYFAFGCMSAFRIKYFESTL
jgi:hypothetical protein